MRSGAGLLVQVRNGDVWSSLTCDQRTSFTFDGAPIDTTDKTSLNQWREQIASQSRSLSISCEGVVDNGQVFKTIADAAFSGAPVELRLVSGWDGVDYAELVARNMFIVISVSRQGGYNNAERYNFNIVLQDHTEIVDRPISDALSVIAQAWFEVVYSTMRLPKTKYIPNCDFV